MFGQPGDKKTTQFGAPSGGGGLFGNSLGVPTGNPFGQSNPSAQPSGSLFGSSSTGTQGTGGSLFGNKPAESGSAFGASAPTQNSQLKESPFGAPGGTNIFGSSSGGGGSQFPAGNPSSTNYQFGACKPADTTEKPAPIFGAQPSTIPSAPSGTSGSLFGSEGPKTPAPGGLFSQPKAENPPKENPLSTTGTLGFGIKPQPTEKTPSSIFGSSSGQEKKEETKPNTSLFVPNPAGGSMFGAKEAEPKAEPEKKLGGGFGLGNPGLYGQPSEPKQDSPFSKVNALPTNPSSGFFQGADANSGFQGGSASQFGFNNKLSAPASKPTTGSMFSFPGSNATSVAGAGLSFGKPAASSSNPKPKAPASMSKAKLTEVLSKKQKLEQLEPLLKFPSTKPSEHTLRLLSEMSLSFLKASTHFSELLNFHQYDTRPPLTGQENSQYSLAVSNYAFQIIALLKSGIQTAPSSEEQAALENNLMGCLIFYLVYMPISESFCIRILEEMAMMLPSVTVLTDQQVDLVKADQEDTGKLCEGIILLLSKGMFAEAHKAFVSNCKFVVQDDYAKAIAEELRTLSTIGMKDLTLLQQDQQRRVREMHGLYELLEAEELQASGFVLACQPLIGFLSRKDVESSEPSFIGKTYLKLIFSRDFNLLFDKKDFADFIQATLFTCQEFKDLNFKRVVTFYFQKGRDLTAKDFLDKMSQAGSARVDPLSVAGPVISYHLHSLLLRFKFNGLHHKVLADNFNFWNYRAMRQFLGWVASIDEKKDKSTSSFCFQLKAIIHPYLATLANPQRKHDLCKEISGVYVSETFASGVEPETQHALMQELTSLVSTLFQVPMNTSKKQADHDMQAYMKGETKAVSQAASIDYLRNSLLEHLNASAAESFREKGLFNQEFAIATKYMADVPNQSGISQLIAYMNSRSVQLLEKAELAQMQKEPFLSSDSGSEVVKIFSQLQQVSRLEEIEASEECSILKLLFALVKISRVVVMGKADTEDQEMKESAEMEAFENIPVESLDSLVLRLKDKCSVSFVNKLIMKEVLLALESTKGRGIGWLSKDSLTFLRSAELQGGSGTSKADALWRYLV